MRYPKFRSFWLGSLASVMGFQMLQASQFWQIHELEESPLYLGYAGVANAVPATALNLFGGVFADKVDKRRLIVATQAILAILILTLATSILLEVVTAWRVLAIALWPVRSMLSTNHPARRCIHTW